MACREAVRFDLRDDEDLGPILLPPGCLGSDIVSLDGDSGRDSSGMEGGRSGWSLTSMVGGDENLSLLGKREERRKLMGVTGELKEGDNSSSSVLRDGVAE
jgi:hypothetical protein